MLNKPPGFILPDNPGLTARALLGPLIADAPIGLALVDGDFRYVFINETQAGFDQLPVPDHLGKTVEEVVGSVVWQQMVPFFQQALSGDLLRSQEVSGAPPNQPDSLRHYLISYYPVRSDRRTVTGVGIVVSDITERKQSEALLAGQNRILEAIAADLPLAETLTALALLIEEQIPTSCSVVLLGDDTGSRLRLAAAPSLPEMFVRQIWGDVTPGEQAVTSGIAAWRKETVVTPHIAADPGWSEHCAEALSHGLLACWASPILGEDQQVLGTFAVFLRETRSPVPRERGLVDAAVHTARIAIERDREQARRRQLLRDMLGSLTEGRLLLCLTEEDLPGPLQPDDHEAMMLTEEALRGFRWKVSETAQAVEMPLERRFDRETAGGAASMNSVGPAGGGVGWVYADQAQGLVQVWVSDQGSGIAEESLHRATLER
ncbi:MAG: PAS domain-containing protein, partial [Cytophagales bacterium]|nr:PAS domain-containing protein [Armatimonadota bacterium]